MLYADEETRKKLGAFAGAEVSDQQLRHDIAQCGISDGIVAKLVKRKKAAKKPTKEEFDQQRSKSSASTNISAATVVFS